MASDSLSQFLDQLYASQLLQTNQVEELIRRPEMPTSDADTVCAYIESRGWLTRFQIDRVRAGRISELHLEGGYRLTDLILDSPNLTIYKALQLAIQRHVVLRLMKPEWFGSRDNAADYLQRAHAVTLLTHPHLVNTLDSGMMNGQPYVATELILGADTGTLVRSIGTMPLVLACDYVYQAALALQAGHERRIFHGDLSPSSLLLSPVVSGETGVVPGPGALIRLMDLGLNPRRIAMNELPFETPSNRIEFQPPERFAYADYSAKGDIFSLGGVLYFLLTGQSSFAGASLPETLQKLQTLEPHPLEAFRPDVPPAVSMLVRRMLSKLPDYRPDAREVAETLRPFAGVNSTAVTKVAPTTVNGVPIASLTQTPAFTANESQSVAEDPISPTSLVVAEIVEDSTAPVAQAMPMSAYTPTAQVPSAYHPEEHHDPFAHGAVHSDEPSAPRPPKKKQKLNPLWLVLGGMLHLTALALLIGLALGWFDSTEERPTKPQSTKKTNKSYPIPNK